MVKANGHKHVSCIHYVKLMVKYFSWHMSYYGSHLESGYTYSALADVFYLGVGATLYLATYANALSFLVLFAVFPHSLT
jgi:hypothetical protein